MDRINKKGTKLRNNTATTTNDIFSSSIHKIDKSANKIDYTFVDKNRRIRDRCFQSSLTNKSHEKSH